MNRKKFIESLRSCVSDEGAMNIIHSSAFTDFTVFVDNDEVIISVAGEDEDSDEVVYTFDEFGYSLIPIILNSIGIKSELV